MPKFICKHCGMITDNPDIVLVEMENYQYKYGIMCPVCLGEIFFWRKEPFPTDEPNDAC